MDKPQVFVTGIESFIGRVLRETLLRDGYYVTGMDIAPPSGYSIVHADIRDPYLAAYIPEDAVIIHLAAVSTDVACKVNPLAALDVNVAGTINVAKCAVQSGCRQFIFASTEWVYRETSGLSVTTEEWYTNGEGVYAKSKAMGEQVLRMSGLPNVTILRFGITYGPRDKNWCAVESIADKVLRGEDMTVGSLRTARRFIHVRDLCAGIVAAIGRTGQETFNLAGERLITLDDILGCAYEAVPTSTAVWDETSPDTFSIRNPDSTKAKEQLEWTPKIAFEDGMREVVEYLRGKK